MGEIGAFVGESRRSIQRGMDCLCVGSSFISSESVVAKSSEKASCLAASLTVPINSASLGLRAPTLPAKRAKSHGFFPQQNVHRLKLPTKSASWFVMGAAVPMRSHHRP